MRLRRQLKGGEHYDETTASALFVSAVDPGSRLLTAKGNDFGEGSSGSNGSVYMSCNSYMDKGRVKEVFFRGSGNRVVIKPFTTAFVRPSRFRFEFTEDSDLRAERFIVWRDGVSIRSWWSIKPETRYYETLGQALAGATGVSSQSAIVVPSMLFQNLGDTRRVQNLTELSLVTEEKVSGRPAYRIEGTDWMNTRVTLWIDKKTFLLVKLFEKRSGKVEVELTIQYEPQVNVDVLPDKLAFKH